jgi:uncharacterized protein (TIGR02757 family)
VSKTQITKPHAQLGTFLNKLVERYHHPRFLGTDPLVMVHGFTDARDREIAALFAALLAYGNVKQINGSLKRLFAAMGGRPGTFVRKFNYATAVKKLTGFKHRFNDEQDILCLCWLLNQIMQKQSLEEAFRQGCDSNDSDLIGALSAFGALLRAQEFGPYFSRKEMLAKSSFRHLLADPGGGSACKRWHLWLRWMVRPADGVDLGLWSTIPASKLLMPVDTHILRICQNLGMINKAAASLVASRAITARLRMADAADPVRYDFALCRLGILQACPTVSNLEACHTCELHPVCAKRKLLERRLRRP